MSRTWQQTVVLGDLSIRLRGAMQLRQDRRDRTIGVGQSWQKRRDKTCDRITWQDNRDTSEWTRQNREDQRPGVTIYETFLFDKILDFCKNL
jgi:hypothetical protein